MATFSIFFAISSILFWLSSILAVVLPLTFPLICITNQIQIFLISCLQLLAEDSISSGALDL